MQLLTEYVKRQKGGLTVPEIIFLCSGYIFWLELIVLPWHKAHLHANSSKHWPSLQSQAHVTPKEQFHIAQKISVLFSRMFMVTIVTELTQWGYMEPKIFQALSDSWAASFIPKTPFPVLQVGTVIFPLLLKSSKYFILQIQPFFEHTNMNYSAKEKHFSLTH